MKRFLIPCLALLPLSSFAGHILTSEILWDCSSNNQYTVVLYLYQDCAGVAPSSQETVHIDSPCGNLVTTVFNTGFTEMSQLCPSEMINSTCNGGTLPGVMRYTYVATVTLQPCNSWTFSWSTCCRGTGGSANLVTNADDLYTQATLNSADHPCDDSPTFLSTAVPYACLNQPYTYSFVAADPDGNHCTYAFAEALGTNGVPMTYQPGYSYLQPVTGIALDALSGVVAFTPIQVGRYSVTVVVTEHDTLGNVIGTVMREAVVMVMPCQNAPPDATSGDISNLTSTAMLAGPNALQVCVGEVGFCFNVMVNDPNASDTVSLTTTAVWDLPGSTFSSTNGNPAVAELCWTIPLGTQPGVYPFTITAQDDACMVQGQQVFDYTVELLACPISVAEVHADALVLVYPVPANYILSVTIAEGSGNVALLLHDGLGRIVPVAWNSQGTAFSADIAALPSALYHLTVLSGHGRSTHAVAVVH